MIVGLINPKAEPAILMLCVNAVALMAVCPLGIASRNDCHWPSLRPWQSVLGLLGLVGLCLSISAISELLELPDNAAESMQSVLQSPMGIGVVALLGPIVEECFFRAGIVGGMMRRGAQPWVAIAVSSLLFGLIHFNPAQIPFATAMGVAFGFVYWRSRSMILTALAHIINNSIVVLAYQYYGAEHINEVRTLDLLGGTMPVVGIAAASLVALTLACRNK